MRNRLFALAAVAGLTAFLGGALATSPTRADEDDTNARRHVRRDINDIHHDQYRLDELYRQRDYLAERRDWRGVRRLDGRIDDLRRHIEQDRRDVHRDIDRNRRDHFRGNNDYRHYDDNTYRNRNRDDSSYRDRDDSSYQGPGGLPR